LELHTVDDDVYFIVNALYLIVYDLHFIPDGVYIFVNGVYCVIDSLHFIPNDVHIFVNGMYCVIDSLHFIVDGLCFVVDSLHSLIYLVGGLQTLRSSHPNFVLCQSLQSTQRILDVRPTNELLHVFP
jgi:hypothetical protein